MTFALKPYSLLLVAGCALMVASVFFISRTVDIHIHDTKYVLPATVYFFGVAFIVLLFWGLYKLVSKYLLTPIISWIHVLITLVCASTLFSIVTFNKAPAKYLDLSPWYNFYRYEEIQTDLLIYLFLGQSLFLINLIGGLIRKFNNS